MAKLLKPIIEKELASEACAELLQDLDTELCVCVAINSSETGLLWHYPYGS